MQLMPGTWAEMRARLALGTDPFDVRDNMLAGTAYLRQLHDRYGWLGALAAYNAGPARYDLYRSAGIQLPLETRSYLARLATDWRDLDGSEALATVREKPVEWTRASLFVGSTDADPALPVPWKRNTAVANGHDNGSVDVGPKATGMFVDSPSNAAKPQPDGIFVAADR